MTSKLRLVTRKSTLALWQAHYIKNLLETLYSDLVVTILGVSTMGDKHLESSLSKIGGKGLFVKELETCLLENKADIAVHSMKDLPAHIPNGLCIGAVLERADAGDALITSLTNQKKGLNNLSALPKGALVGSSSLRRQSQIYALRRDVQVKTLRGNVDTRLQKLDAGAFDAIVLAVSGLQRLGLEARISETFDHNMFIPAVGQGALCIECRQQDEHTQALIKPLHHLETGWCTMAERRMNARLEGGCQLPVGGFARIDANGQLILKGFVGSADGQKLIRIQAQGLPQEAESIGDKVAMGLLDQGAQNIINDCYA